MNRPEVDRMFAGSIPQLYEDYLVPLIFDPYAQDMAGRVAALQPERVLEVAAGTGAVTRRLVRALPAETELVATDLNQPMLDRAAALEGSDRVTWKQADALQLPFPDGSFDVVVCQFGAMFFPDKARAYAEARRVLRDGGVLVFNVWDRLEENDVPRTVNETLARVFPDDPPSFMARVPHGYYQGELIAGHLAAAGFTRTPDMQTVAARSRAAGPRIPAIGFCQGTPVRNEIEARAPERLQEATDAVADAIERHFGSGPIDGKIQAHVIAIER